VCLPLCFSMCVFLSHCVCLRVVCLFLLFVWVPQCVCVSHQPSLGTFCELSGQPQFSGEITESTIFKCWKWTEFIFKLYGLKKKPNKQKKKKTPTNLHYLARFRLRLNLLVLFNELMMPRIGWGSWVWDMERAHLFRWAWVWTQDELPRYTCSKESICHCGRCRRHRFSPWVRKIPVDKEMATHSSILAWKDPMWKRAWQSTVHGVAKSQTQQCVLTHTQPLGETFKPIWASASPSEAYDFLLI